VLPDDWIVRPLSKRGWPNQFLIPQGYAQPVRRVVYFSLDGPRNRPSAESESRAFAGAPPQTRRRYAQHAPVA
jgi:hypothetical protein